MLSESRNVRARSTLLPSVCACVYARGEELVTVNLPEYTDSADRVRLYRGNIGRAEVVRSSRVDLSERQDLNRDR